jgi:hypothetical protein
MTKAENPKDAIGSKKLPVHLWPNIATAYGSIGMAEGARKYGRNNFIAAPVRAHIYVAAAMRHLMAWMEGEEYSEVGVPHLGNALATIAIILKARQNGTLIDDREFLTDIGEGAYGAEVEHLVQCLRNMESSVKVDKEPKHWDRRDVVEEVVVEPKPEMYARGVHIEGEWVVLPPDAAVFSGNHREAILTYRGPAPADGAVTSCDSVESSLAKAGWRFEHVMLRRGILRVNPELQHRLVFNRLDGYEVKVQLLKS